MIRFLYEQELVELSCRCMPCINAMKMRLPWLRKLTGRWEEIYVDVPVIVLGNKPLAVRCQCAQQTD